MPGMRGLTIIVTTSAAERFDAAVELAASWAALGGRARLFCRGSAVTRLDDPMLNEALAGGVAVIACQTGLADHGGSLAACDSRIAAGGMVTLLAELGDDRLVTL